jgi:hypothetical protein
MIQEIDILIICLKKGALMKRMILCALTFFSCLYGMEKVTGNQIIRYKYAGTLILLALDDIYQRKLVTPAGITVVGKMEQSVLKGGSLEEKPVAGDISKSANNSLLLLDSALRECFNYRFRCPDEPMSLIIKGKKVVLGKPYDHVEIEKADGTLVFVVEPDIIGSVSCPQDYTYSPYRRITKATEPLVVMQDFYGDEALAEGKKDLGLCYTNLLEYAHEFFSENSEKSIAFPILSRALGMPTDIAIEVAVVSVMQFLQKSHAKGKYSDIQFVVERAQDFNCYKKLLDQLIGS